MSAGQADEGFAIDVRGLAKSFGGRRVVENCTIQVPYGAIYGFLGPNGTGKTTSIRMICGLLTPDAGSGTCLGLDVRREMLAIRRMVGYMPQKFGLYEDLTIIENLRLVARLYGVPRAAAAADAAVERLGLGDRRRQLAGELSGGWKQRLSLAAATIHSPRLLLLDEPTAGVDPKARREFWDHIHVLAGEGVTVLVSTHYMDEAERCHLIGYLSHGRLLVHGTVEAVLAGAGLATFEVTAEDPAAVLALLKRLPGVESVAPFGQRLHVSGPDAGLIAAGLAELPGIAVAAARPNLEDVFIHIMERAAR
ncbi:MAG: ABC transporter ATP-binding protein [Thalassobaculales bacterium]